MANILTTYVGLRLHHVSSKQPIVTKIVHTNVWHVHDHRPPATISSCCSPSWKVDPSNIKLHVCYNNVSTPSCAKLPMIFQQVLTHLNHVPTSHLNNRKSSQSMTINHHVTSPTCCSSSWKAGPSISSYMPTATYLVDLIMCRSYVNRCHDTPTQC